jgi:hypothetical protein
MEQEKSITVSELVSIVYCERKYVLDRRHGRHDTPLVRAAAARGQLAHARFEAAGRAEMAGANLADRRCFIATAVYGPDAAETDALRAWRDRALLPSRAGRIAVRCYYAISPAIACALARLPAIARLVRVLLNAVVACVQTGK